MIGTYRSGLRILALLLCLCIEARPASAEVIVVVSRASPVRSLDKAQVKDIFLGRKRRFLDGQLAVPVDQKIGSTERDEFYATFAGMSSVQLRAYWLRVIFTGQGQPPMAASGGTEMKKALAANPLAIGYLDRSDLDSSVRELRAP